MLATLHFLAWCRDRRSWANLCFPIMVLGVVGLGIAELFMLWADSPGRFSEAGRWAHFCFGICVAGSLGFVHFYFGTGRNSLLFSALGLRLLAVVMNITTGENLHFEVIHSLRQVTLFGEPVAIVDEGVENPWVRVGQLAALMQIVYIVDASLRLWRRRAPNDRRRAVMVGGSLGFFIFFASGHAGLAAAGMIHGPLLVSFPFFAMVLAINHELSRDLLRAARLAKDLKDSETRLALAASAAGIALWEWDLRTDRIWIPEVGRRLYGVGPDEMIDMPGFFAVIHPDDRSRVTDAIQRAVNGTQPYAVEYRIILRDGVVRWLAATGRLERDELGKAVLVRGVSLDITPRKVAEKIAAEHHFELAHLSRISVLGELAGSLAHELNQPLAAMLSNAQVGLRSMKSETPDLRDMEALLADVAADAKRAGGIVHGMRAMFKKDSLPQIQAVDLNGVVTDVLQVLHSAIFARHVTVEVDATTTMPPVAANRVEIQQVLINLLLNSLEALGESDHGAGRPDMGRIDIAIGREGDLGVVTVRDNGPGIPPDMVGRLFEPFSSTKPDGLGLGLSISRKIVERFGGTLAATCENGRAGAVFRLTLPVTTDPSDTCQPDGERA
jgi:PAS domain S-box-containing protein